LTPIPSLLLRSLLLPVLLSVLAVCSGCDRGGSVQTGSDAQAELVFVFQKQADPTAIRDHADALGREIAARTGHPIRVVVPTDYSASVQALVSGQADFAYVSAIPFLLAKRDGGATVVVAEERRDASGTYRTTYDSVFVVPADSELRTIEDLVARAKDLRVCFTSATSTSGYVMAFSRLVDEGLLQPRQNAQEVFASVNFGGGYTQALQQVLNGRADVCAVSFYTVEGPDADVYTNADERSRLRVLARTPAVPTHLICARGGLDPVVVDRVREALLIIALEQPELVQRVYGAARLVPVGEDHVKAAAVAIERLGISLDAF